MQADLSSLKQQVFSQRLIDVIGLLGKSEVLWIVERGMGQQRPSGVTPGDHPQT